MPQFQYTARLATGEQTNGSMCAPSRRDVLQLLGQQSLMPVSVNEVKELKVGSGRIKGAALAAMYELLADLLDSGVALLKALDILIEQASHPVLQTTLADLRSRVANGQSLADSMTAHPAVFHELPISMVRAGEEGGFLQDSLKRIAKFTEQQEEMKGRVLGALAYPAFLTVVGGIVVTGMLAFFVPKFEPMFARMRDRGELPVPTSMLLAVSEFLQSYGLWMILGLLVAAFMAKQSLSTDSMKMKIDRIKMNLAGLGPIVRNLAIARFCRVLGTLLKNGVPMLRSLQIASAATGNRALSATINEAAENVSSGKSLSAPLTASGQFPRDVLEMISVGEQANRLDGILLEVAEKLDRRTQRKLDVLVKLLEPALMLVMAIVIGFLVVALLMPIFESNGLT